MRSVIGSVLLSVGGGAYLLVLSLVWRLPIYLFVKFLVLGFGIGLLVLAYYQLLLPRIPVRRLSKRCLKKYAEAELGQLIMNRHDTLPWQPPEFHILERDNADIQIAESSCEESSESTRLLNPGKYLLVGDEGIGKTSLLNMVAQAGYSQLCEDSTLPIPILLYLRQLPTSQTIVSAAEERLQAFCKRSISTAFAQAIESGQVLFLLDGLDEVPSHEFALFLKKVSDLVKNHGSCSVILTERRAPPAMDQGITEVPHITSDDPDPRPLNDFTLVAMKPPTNQDNREYFEQVLGKPRGSRLWYSLPTSTTELCKVRLWRSYILRLAKSGKQPWGRPSKLCSELLELSLAKWEQEKGLKVRASKAHILRECAEHLAQLAVLQRLSRRRAELELRQLGQHTETINFLIKCGVLMSVGDSLRFPHRAMRDFLAACALYAHHTEKEFLSDIRTRCMDEEWTGPLKYLSGLLGNESILSRYLTILASQHVRLFTRSVVSELASLDYVLVPTQTDFASWYLKEMSQFLNLLLEYSPTLSPVFYGKGAEYGVKTVGGANEQYGLEFFQVLLSPNKKGYQVVSRLEFSRFTVKESSKTWKAGDRESPYFEALKEWGNIIRRSIEQKVLMPDAVLSSEQMICYIDSLEHRHHFGIEWFEFDNKHLEKALDDHGALTKNVAAILSSLSREELDWRLARLPTADIVSESWVPARYSKKRLSELVKDMMELAIRSYQQVVRLNFPQLADVLSFNSQFPMIIEIYLWPYTMSPPLRSSPDQKTGHSVHVFYRPSQDQSCVILHSGKPVSELMTDQEVFKNLRELGRYQEGASITSRFSTDGSRFMRETNCQVLADFVYRELESDFRDLLDSAF